MLKKTSLAFVTTAVLAASVVSSASATNLKEAGVTLPAGASIVGTNVGNVLFTAGELTVTCTTTQRTSSTIVDASGTVLEESNVTTEVYAGTGPQNKCTSPLGPTLVRKHSKQCTHFVNSSTGTATGCGGNLKLTLSVEGLVTCNYTAASMKVTATTAPADAALNISEQPFSEEEPKSFLCPDTGKLDMEQVLTTTNGTTLQFTT